jgi:hypothetical protein
MPDHKHAGHCLCGAVSYTISVDPMMVGHCCCKDCQRATGAAHMTAAMFPVDAFTVEGDTKQHVTTADSGNIVTRHFCPECGGRLFADNSGSEGTRAVMVGSLDNPDAISPMVIVYGDSRLSWDMHDENLTVFPGMA